MQLADAPAKIPTPFGSAAGPSFIRPIPATSQIGVQDGAASWPTGFVPDNFLPVDAGGVPPFGADMNGVLNAISAWAQWVSAGAPVVYDPTFVATIGGYPKGAFLFATSGTHNWLNLVDANSTDPDAGGANWAAVGPFGNIMSLNIGAGLFNDGNGRLAAAGGTETYINAALTPAMTLVPGAYLLDTSGGPLALAMNASPVRGQQYRFRDSSGSFGRYPVTMTGAGGVQIGNKAGRPAPVDSMVICMDGLQFGIWFNGTIWELV